MKEIEKIFKFPVFKNKREETEFKERAYNTFCVEYLNTIKNNIGLEIEVINKYFDEETKREIRVIKISALMPSFMVKGNVLEKYVEKKSFKKIKDPKAEIVNKLPKEDKEKEDKELIENE
jgi:hypothetical protein